MRFALQDAADQLLYRRALVSPRLVVDSQLEGHTDSIGAFTRAKKRENVIYLMRFRPERANFTTVEQNASAPAKERPRLMVVGGRQHYEPTPDDVVIEHTREEIIEKGEFLQYPEPED